MEVKITDLFDDIPDVSFSIPHCIAASDERIIELTKNKLHDGHVNNQPMLAGRSIVKVILLAAVLVCLSFTVFAVLSGPVSRWLCDIPQVPKGYDNDLYIGSDSKNWDVGNRLISLEAESVSVSGLTVVCMDLESQAQSGDLSTDDTYWLEKWNGSDYGVYLPEKASIVSQNSITIHPNATVLFPINWKENFGTLAPGYYRLGKIFRYTSVSGEAMDVPCYVKFRIFEDDNTSCFNQYDLALRSLRGHQNWHVTLLVYPEDSDGYTFYTQEIIKFGKNYWEDIRYLSTEGTQVNHSGSAVVNGLGYRLIQSEVNASLDTIRYQPDSGVRENAFSYWFTLLTLSDARISEISRLDNGILFKEKLDHPSEAMETVLILDESGQIESINQYRINEKEKKLYCTLTVHNTDASQLSEIMDIIAP